MDEFCEFFPASFGQCFEGFFFPFRAMIENSFMNRMSRTWLRNHPKPASKKNGGFWEISLLDVGFKSPQSTIFALKVLSVVYLNKSLRKGIFG